MGGKAFEGTKRLSAADYKELSDRLMVSLQQAFPAAAAQLVRSLHGKADFGDADVLLVKDELPTSFVAVAAGLLGATQSRSHRNDPVASFLVGGFQVDLVRVPRSEFAASRAYFAWNDLGNLMGRVAHQMGFSWGFTGLRYRLKDGDHQFADLLVTPDPGEAFAFMGYGREALPVHEQGFETAEEMFRFAASSDYFDPRAYKLDNLDHRARSRDRKRTNYQAFLAWLASTDVQPGRMAASTTREHHLARALEHFPAFAAAYVEACRTRERDTAAKAKFNGDMASAWTGLTGKGLGQLMAALRASVPDEQADLSSFVLATDEAGLRAWVEQVSKTLNPVQMD